MEVMIQEEPEMLVPFEDVKFASENFHRVCVNLLISTLTNSNPYFRAFKKSLELSGKLAEAKATEKQYRSILHNAELLLATVTAIAAERQYGR